MANESFTQKAGEIANEARELANEVAALAAEAGRLDTAGVAIERDVPVFGAIHKTNVHTQFKFTDVIVPKENLIGEEGAGFAIGQAIRTPEGVVFRIQRTGSNA